jgi:radical SAM superfamily enzyme YgiQ (UPF0313 family)
MVLGFDHDDETIFDAQVRFTTDARVINVMLGMLSAIPKTPLYDRMIKEGRLDTSPERECGTNIIPLRLTRKTLSDGFVYVLSALNETAAYFDRLEALYVDARLDFGRGAQRFWRRHPVHLAKAWGLTLAQSAAFFAQLMWKMDDSSLRREYLRRIWRMVRARRDPRVFWITVVKCMCHYHAHTMAQHMSGGQSPVINTY